MDTVIATSRSSAPAAPSMYTTGRNTTIVVSVTAMTAFCTSSVPRTGSAVRSMLSSTTIELSSSMPTPSARPASDMRLSDTPNASISANVATTEIGMDSATAIG